MIGNSNKNIVKKAWGWLQFLMTERDDKAKSNLEEKQNKIIVFSDRKTLWSGTVFKKLR